MTDAWYCTNAPCGSGTNGYTSSWTGARLEAGHLGEYLHQLTGIAPIPGAIGPGPNTADPNTERNVRDNGANIAGIIGQGDILYIDGNVDNKPYPHVALIVGWGPYVTNWDAIWSASLADNYSTENPVPYVIDHGPHSGVYAEARPYYALAWSGNEQFILPNYYRFVKVPTSATLSLDEAQRRVPSFTKEQMLGGTR